MRAAATLASSFYCFCSLIWISSSFRIIVGMIVFHLLMTGVLSLKESFYASAAMVPLPVITVLFFLFIQQHFLKPSMHLTLNMASGLAEASPHFLQVCHVTCDIDIAVVAYSTSFPGRGNKVCCVPFIQRNRVVYRSEHTRGHITGIWSGYKHLCVHYVGGTLQGQNGINGIM